MGRVFKVIGWIVGLILLALVVLIAVLPMVFDPNDYKDEIVAQVRDRTGRELQIGGPISLTVFPWLGFQVTDLRLGNARGFGDTPFAAADKVAVRIQLTPLLQKRVVADTLTLHGLQLNLARSADGRGNWEDLAAGSRADTAGTEEPAAAEEGAGLEELRIGGIDISNARVTWDDRVSGRRLVIDNLNLETGELAPGRPVELRLGLSLDNEEPQLRADIGLEGVVKLDQAAAQVDISGLKLRLDASGAALPGGAVKAELEAAVQAALDGSRLQLSDLRLTSGELRVSGGLTGTDLATGPKVDGNLDLEPLDLATWLRGLGVALPPMADPKALSRVEAKLALAVRGGQVALPRIDIGLDDTRITGEAGVEGGAVRFQLALDRIDLDRYLPPPASEGATAKGGNGAKSGTGAGSEPPLYPVETLRNLNLDGVLTIGRLVVNRLVAEKIRLTVKAKDGRLKLDQKVGAFYQGSYKGLFDLNVSGKRPVTRVRADAREIQVGPLLKDMTGRDRLTGRGRFGASLQTTGNTLPAMKRGLDGKLDFRFEDGAVKGFNLAQVIRETKARFKGEPLPSGRQPQQTDFSEISATATIARGVLSNRDLLAKSPFLRVTGKGRVNLVDETLDYTAVAVVVSTSKGQGGEGLEELKGVQVPVHLTGSLASPDYRIDWAKVLLESQKGRAKEEIQEKIDEKLKDKVPEGLRNQLKGLFN